MVGRHRPGLTRCRDASRARGGSRHAVGAVQALAIAASRCWVTANRRCFSLNRRQFRVNCWWPEEGALATVRARCKLGNPPGDHQEASTKEEKATQKPLGFIRNHKKNSEDRSCACNSYFLGFHRLLGWVVHLGMVHWCLTTNSCRRADAVRARCNDTL